MEYWGNQPLGPKVDQGGSVEAHLGRVNLTTTNISKKVNIVSTPPTIRKSRSLIQQSSGIGNRTEGAMWSAMFCCPRAQSRIYTTKWCAQATKNAVYLAPDCWQHPLDAPTFRFTPKRGNSASHSFSTFCLFLLVKPPGSRHFPFLTKGQTQLVESRCGAGCEQTVYRLQLFCDGRPWEV